MFVLARCTMKPAMEHMGSATSMMTQHKEDNVIPNPSKLCMYICQLPAISEIRPGIKMHSFCLSFLPRNDTVRVEAAYLTKLLCSLLIVIIHGKCFEVTA